MYGTCRSRKVASQYDWARNSRIPDFGKGATRDSNIIHQYAKEDITSGWNSFVRWPSWLSPLNQSFESNVQNCCVYNTVMCTIYEMTANIIGLSTEAIGQLLYQQPHCKQSNPNSTHSIYHVDHLLHLLRLYTLVHLYVAMESPRIGQLSFFQDLPNGFSNFCPNRWNVGEGLWSSYKNKCKYEMEPMAMITVVKSAVWKHNKQSNIWCVRTFRNNLAKMRSSDQVAVADNNIDRIPAYVSWMNRENTFHFIRKLMISSVITPCP